ncbi:MAG: hypothetical protein Q9M43_10735 [Sulfurimonas sp.]|nr:hypothetical protein [Sulfurimonas sp.]
MKQMVVALIETYPHKLMIVVAIILLIKEYTLLNIDVWISVSNWN